MKHLSKKQKFASSKSQSKSIVRNIASDLIKYKYVTTTKGRAQAVKPFLERIFSKAKNKKTGFDNYIKKLFGNDKLVNDILKLCKDNFSKIDSGFVSIYKLGFRKGDGAQMVRILLYGYEPKKKTKLKKVGKKTKKEKKETSKKGFSKIKNILKKKDKKESQVKSDDTDRMIRSRSEI